MRPDLFYRTQVILILHGSWRPTVFWSGLFAGLRFQTPFCTCWCSLLFPPPCGPPPPPPSWLSPLLEGVRIRGGVFSLSNFFVRFWGFGVFQGVFFCQGGGSFIDSCRYVFLSCAWHFCFFRNSKDFSTLFILFYTSPLLPPVFHVGSSSPLLIRGSGSSASVFFWVFVALFPGATGLPIPPAFFWDLAIFRSRRLSLPDGWRFIFFIDPDRPLFCGIGGPPPFAGSPRFRFFSDCIRPFFLAGFLTWRAGIVFLFFFPGPGLFPPVFSC